MAIDFYFYFSSPYGFIAAMQIDAIERAVRWRPFLLGAVYKTFGQSPLDHPLKRKYRQTFPSIRCRHRGRSIGSNSRIQPRRSRSPKWSIVGIGSKARLPAMPP